MKVKYIVFDLDDTLVCEIDFLKSAYWEIASIVDKRSKEKLYNLMFSKYQNGENVFDFITREYAPFSKEQLLEIYRSHVPDIVLNEGANDILEEVKSKGYKLGLITDGRSITQRNKLKALNIEHLFDKIIVSEEFGSAKPNENNYKVFHQDNIKSYFYIGDNTNKDFISANKLGWTTVCLLDNGQNIHLQNFHLSDDYLPKHRIKDLREIINII